MSDKEEAVICEARHTKFQPSDDEWKCPKCFSTDWYIEENHEGSDERCSRLHTEDFLMCPSCGHSEFAAKFANRIAKALNLVACPCCKGKGMVSKDSQKV